MSLRKADSTIQLIHPQHPNRRGILLQHPVSSMVTGPLHLERLQPLHVNVVTPVLCLLLPLLVLPHVGRLGRRVAHLYNITPSLPFLSYR